jgi:ATP-binding cassette subfamily B protein
VEAVSTPIAPAPPSSPPGSLALLRRGSRFLAGHRLGVVAVIALGSVSAALAAADPYLTKLLLDALGGHSRWRSIVVLLVAIAAMALSREVVSAVHDWLSWRVRIGVNEGLLHATVDRLHALPISFHRKEGTGAVLTKIERGVSGSVNAFADIAFTAIPSIGYLVASIAVMLQLDTRLSILVFSFVPFPALLGVWASHEQSERERALLERWSKIFARFNEVLSGIVLVKSFAMEEVEKRRFLGGVTSANGLVVRGVARDASVTMAKNVVALVARLSAMAYGGLLVWRGQSTLGTLVAFLGYAGGLFGPVQSLTTLYQTLRKGLVSLEVVDSILSAQDSLGDAPDARAVGRLEGRVRFDDVGFAYADGVPVLERVDLDVKPGQTIAIVGPSGSGKSTLMRLLQRLYDATHGEIRLDGVPIRSLQQRSVRQNIGVVLQEAVVFDDSIRDNIAFGRPGATMDQIVAAAKAAHAHEFISALPNGYDTLAGERGCRLSGGERQRIAIARAVLKDPSILILDEATSALDIESEAHVQAALRDLTRGRTTFMIAHRLSTIAHADQIVFVRDGMIAEQGTHAELMARNGDYAAAVKLQLGSYGVDVSSAA